MNWLRVFLFFYLILWFQLNCLGSGYSFYRISIENGLSNNHVNALFKDSYGYIWMGTIDGLDRFDGIEIRPYTSRFPEKVENVHAITEDFYKNLWVGSSNGLFRFNKQTDQFERLKLNDSRVTVHSLVVLPDSNLCVGTSKGLLLVNTRKFQAEQLELKFDQKPDCCIITGIFPDNHGNCWLATENGLVRYSFMDRQSDYFECPLLPKRSNNSFTSICNIGNKLYLGTQSEGIVEFDLHDKTFSKGISLDNNIILTLSSDNRERIFAGTDGAGLKIINIRSHEVESIVNQENDQSSISSNSVYAFYLDKNDRFWVGTFSAGVCYTKNITGNFKVHALTANHPDFNKSIRSFHFAPDGNKYIGTRNGFVHLSKNGNSKYFQSVSGDNNGLRSNIILSVFPFQNDILIGTYGGGVSLYSVDNQKILPFLNSGINSNENVYSFDTDKSGNLWISSFNGLYRYSPTDKSLLNFTTQNSVLSNDQVFSIRFDSKGRLWVGTVSGTFVYSVSGNDLKKINLSIIADNTYKTNYIYEDQVGNIWLCTERGGLIEIDPELKNSTTLRDSDGLPDNSICSIIEGNTGIYWISTLKGFCRYSNQSNQFSKYSMIDGLPGLVFTPAASYLSDDGTFYFGNEKGLVSFKPEDIVESSVSSKIRITDFYILGKEVTAGENSVLKQIIEETDEIVLNSRQNSIGFRFVSMNYSNPVDNEYVYQLVGYDKEWRSNGSNNAVFYEKLSPGKYLFKVKNANESDLENVAEIKVVVLRSFFSSVYFFILLFIILSAGIFIMIRYIKILQKKAKKLFERTEIEEKPEKYKGSRISKSQSELIISALKKHMEEEKPYLNAELKLGDLATEINFSVNDVSQVLNQDLQQSFSDYINKYRVEEVKRRIEDKAYEKFTFIAISQQCGFNSKTSFYRIFKNEVGKTPADYVKDLKQSDRETK